MRRLFATLFATVAVLTAVTSCAASPSAGGTKSGDVDPAAVVIDVRTPAEYASGHLDGARLLDMNAGQVATAIPDLDPTATYLVYCRSGNRAEQAVMLMHQAGLNDVTNLGSLPQAAEETGLQIVR